MRLIWWLHLKLSIKVVSSCLAFYAGSCETHHYGNTESCWHCSSSRFDKCRELRSARGGGGERQVGGKGCYWREDRAEVWFSWSPAMPSTSDCSISAAECVLVWKAWVSKAAYTRQSALVLSNSPRRLETAMCFRRFGAFYTKFCASYFQVWTFTLIIKIRDMHCGYNSEFLVFKRTSGSSCHFFVTQQRTIIPHCQGDNGLNPTHVCESSGAAVFHHSKCSHNHR